MILNFDQTPLEFTSPNKITYIDKGSEPVPITNIGDRLTDRYHPRIKLCNSFHITHSNTIDQMKALC